MAHDKKKIAFQGETGANSDMACRDMFAEMEPHFRGRIQCRSKQ